MLVETYIEFKLFQFNIYLLEIFWFKGVRFGKTLIQKTMENLKLSKPILPNKSTGKVIKTFLDKFEMKSCILIGHSTGGLIANWFAYQYPSYVDALILVSPTGYMPSFVRSMVDRKYMP